MEHLKGIVVYLGWALWVLSLTIIYKQRKIIKSLRERVDALETKTQMLNEDLASYHHRFEEMEASMVRMRKHVDEYERQTQKLIDTLKGLQ